MLLDDNDQKRDGQLMLMLAATQLLLIVDASIVNVIVPTITGELSFSDTGQSWIANAYLTFFGGALLVAGRFADLFGRAKIFRLGLLVLALGSVIAAGSNSPQILIFGRAVQGLGSALAAAASLALIFSTFEGEQRHKALGLLAAMGGLGGAAGTFLGGALTEWLGWRSTFWLSVVIPVMLLLFSIRVFSRNPERVLGGRVDGFGGVILISGLTLLAFGIISSAESGVGHGYAWISSIAAALVMLLLFIFWQTKTSYPLMPPSTWRNFKLMEALVCSGVGQFVIFPMFFIGNLYLQNVLSYSPMASGASFLPLCGAVIIVATNASFWLRLGEHVSLALGFFLVAAGMFWLSVAGVEASFVRDVLGPTLLVGCGLPMIAISSNILGAKNAIAGEEGLVSGLLTTSQQFGAVVGISAMVSLASYYSGALGREGYEWTGPNLLAGYQSAFLMGSIISSVFFVLLIFRKIKTVER